jgi:acyl-CoA synthetase (AMP-forming)/AMP-acid ligase II
VLTLSPDGEILYRGPTLMTGYLDRPEETAQALAGGWYHTGDLGTIDDEGYLHITGRAREIIRTGGETVAPPEVETALASYPGIRDTAVIGVPDEHWGEVVCAVVVLEADAAPPDVESLRNHVADVLAAFKHPRRVVVVDAIPRTAATGQVQRALLREQVAIASASNDR